MTKGWYGDRYAHGLASKGVRTTPYKRSGRIFKETTFELEDGVYIVCRSENTSRGFRHIAEFYVGDNMIATESVNYLNRTWEKYDFQTVISNLLGSMGRPEIERDAIMGTIEEQAIGRVDDQMKTIAMVSSLGNIFGTTIKERNDWKLRMIKAGMGEGIQLPDDWDDISEEDKEVRLDKIIEFMEER